MIAVDSSVVVPALLTSHDHHERARRALDGALQSAGGCVIAAHALFESYAVLTRLPLPFRIAPADVLRALQETFASASVAALASRSAWPLIRHLAARSLGGGIMYDAIMLESCVSAGATELLTLNPRDYERLDPAIDIVSI